MYISDIYNFIVNIPASGVYFIKKMILIYTYICTYIFVSITNKILFYSEK